MKGSERLNSSGAHDGESSGSEVSRRSFLRDAANALAGVGLGASLLAENSNNSLKTEGINHEQGEKNWEYWQGKLLEELNRAEEYFTRIDPVTLAQEERGRSYVAGESRGSIDSAQDDISHQIKESKHKIQQIRILHTQLEHVLEYRDIILPIVQGIEESKRKSLEHRPTINRWVYKEVLAIIERQVKNVFYKRKIFDEYHVEVVCRQKDLLHNNFEIIYKDFQKFPPFLIKNARLPRMVIREFLEKTGYALSNTEIGTGPDIQEGTIPHEVTHYLDFLHESILNLLLKQTDDAGWENLNKNAVPYKHSTGLSSILANGLSKAERPESRERWEKPELKKRWKDYVSTYAATSAMEDKAATGEALVYKNALDFALRDAVHSPALKRKIEYMAGYRLDVPWKCVLGGDLDQSQRDALKEYEQYAKPEYKVWVDKTYSEESVKLLKQAAHDEQLRKTLEFIFGQSMEVVYQFGTPIGDEEYKAAGFPQREYWSAWSRDNNGKIWMDADYYNALLDGKRVWFGEENGQTKLYIE